ncbi:MAG: hypothetical protein EHM28_14200, partial [Spirochaetaceae bacterium]
GVAVIFVLLGSNIGISLLKSFIPEKVRIPAYIIVIAAFVTIVDLVMQAYIQPLSESLGVFVPLIVVNCIILGRAEGFANRNTVGDSILDALGMGMGFTIAVTFIAFIREVLGSGTITLISMPFLPTGIIEVPGLHDAPAGIFVTSAGALLVMGFLKGFFNVKKQWALAIKKGWKMMIESIKNLPLFGGRKKQGEQA